MLPTVLEKDLSVSKFLHKIVERREFPPGRFFGAVRDFDWGFICYGEVGPW